MAAVNSRELQKNHWPKTIGCAIQSYFEISGCDKRQGFEISGCDKRQGFEISGCDKRQGFEISGCDRDRVLRSVVVTEKGF